MIETVPAPGRLFVLVLLVFLPFLGGCGKGEKDGPQLNDYASMRDEVIKRVKNGTLTADAAGVVLLPPDLQGAAADGRVLIGNDTNTGLLVLFKTMPREPNEIMGLLYSDRSLPPSPSRVSFGPLALKIRRRINGHWSEITYRI